MADPIVHLTNGIPDSGTGNVTTLGQTLLDGANITLGAVADAAITAGAAGTINAHLRSISRDIAGGIVLQAGAATIGAVNQAGAPWSVSGTVAATQSGAWNIGNVTGTVSLPTGAATSALQPTNASLGSSTSGQTGNLSLGAVTTAAPAYTTGQTNVLSLTTTGLLRVDGSGVTQPVSGTVAVSGTIPVSQSGTWTVQPGNTPNTVPWLTTIQQGGNAATVSAAGALKVDASATTQPISAAALPLPSGAATAALQPTNAAQGSTTSGQTGGLSQGAAATSAPTYVNGTTNPISMTLAGAIRVDGSATTQPVSGTVAATQSGVWNQRLQDGSGNAITSDARGSARPLAVEILDASGNQITSFGAGSGPSFGSAIPSTGTAVGFNDGVNLQMARVFDADSGAGFQYVLGALLKKPASGGAVDFGTSSDPIRIDPTGTTTQPVSLTSTTITGTVAVTQSGTWNLNNISGTISLPSGAATSANQPSNVASASTTSGQTGNLSFGAVTTAAPSYTNAQSNPLSLTTAGALRVDGSGVTQPVSGSVSISGTVPVSQSGTWNINNVSGTVSLPTGAATSANQPTNAALGSTTSGQTGQLSLGAVTSAAPSYVTGQTNALSLTTTGALRTDSSATTQPISGTVTASQGGTWTVQPGNTANTTPWLTSISQGGNTASVTASSALKVDNSAVTQPVSGTVTANQGGNWTTRIVGNAGAVMDFAGQNAAAPANSLLVAGEFNTSPTTISSGNASPLQLDNAGNLKVNVVAGGAAGGGTSSSYGSAFPASGTAAGFSDGSNMQGARVFDADTGAGFQYVLGALLKKPASGGSVDFGTSSDPIRVDPTGTTTQPVSGTVSISGTVAATQSGTWNITNISGTVSLPTGAATSANQATAAALGSTTSGQTGGLALGAVTTAAPSYTTGQSNALSLTLAGALRTDSSATTQPVSGTFWQATQPVSGTFWQATQPVSIAAAVNVQSSTAPVSTMNSASANSGLNSAMAAVFDDVTPTSITENSFGFVRMSANRNQYMTIRDAAGNERGVNVTSGNALVVDASATTQPVSGTVTANQGGTWNITNVSGTVSLPTGASTSANQPSNASQGSTTSGQTGTLAMGAVTTGNPTYTTAQTSPLSLDTSGALRVNVIAGSGGGGTSSSFGSAFPSTGTAIGAKDSSGVNMQPLNLDASGNLKVAVTGAGSGGTSATDEATFTAGTTAFTPSGGFFQTTATNNALTTGQHGEWQMTANRAGFVNLRNAAGGETGINGVPLYVNITPNVIGAYTWTSATALNSTAIPYGSNFLAYSSITGSITTPSTLTGGVITFEESYDNNTTYKNIPAGRLIDPVTGLQLANPLTLVANTVQAWKVISAGVTWVRLRLSTVIAGAGNTVINSTSQPFGDAASVFQSNAANLNATVVGTGTFATQAAQSGTWNVGITGTPTISGTVTANQGGAPWSENITQFGGTNISTGTGAGGAGIPRVTISNDSTVNPTTQGNWGIGTTTQNSSMASWGHPVLGQFNTSPTTITSGNMSPLQVNSTGSLKVDGSGVTQPVSATSLPLPSGAATSANQPTAVGFGNTSGGTGYAAFGFCTTAAPSYTTGLSYPISLTLSGGVRVDGSAVTQPVSGTFWQATQPVSIAAAVTVQQSTASSLKGQVDPLTIANWGLAASTQNVASPTNGQLVQGQFNTSPTTITSGNSSPLQLDASGNLRVNIMAGAGSGGTASTFNAAFPSQGTAMGATDGTNMKPLTIDGAGNLKVSMNPTVWNTNAAAWNSSTTIGTTIVVYDSTAVVQASVAGQMTQTTTITAGAVTFEESFDGGLSWKTIPVSRFIDPVTGNQLTNPYTFVASTNQAFQIVFAGAYQVRARLSTAITGTGSVTLNWSRQLSDGAAQVVVGTGTFPMQIVQGGNTATVSAGGALKVDGSAVTQPVSGTFWQTTQPVSGTFWQTTQPVSIAAIVSVQSSTAPVTTMNSPNANGGINSALAGVFDDTTPTAATENNFGFLRMSANRNLYGTIRDAAGNERGVNVTTGNALTVDGSATTQPVSIAASVTVAQATSSNLKAQVDPLTAASWGIGTSTQNSATVANGHLVLGQYNSAPTTVTTGNMSPLQLDASANLRVAIGSGANYAAVKAASTAAVAGDPALVVAISPNSNVIYATVAGDAANATADGGNPIKIGGRATTGIPTPVTDGQRVNGSFDKVGKLLTAGAVRGMKNRSVNSITTASAITIIGAGGAGVFSDVYAIVATNKSATAVSIVFNDGTSTALTLAVPAGDTRGFTVPVDSAINQSTANQAWTATVSTAVTSIELTVLYVLNN